MKYKWLLGAGIISVILTGCKADTSANINSTPNETQQSQAAEQNSKPTPSEVESNVTATVTTEENKQKEIKLPDELLIDGWKVGVPFSEVVGKLPEDAKLDNSYMQYSFKFKNFDLSFTWGGILHYIFTSEPGKGLNINLNIGDDEQKIEKVLGKPKQQSNTKDGYLANTYSFEVYDITIFAKDNAVQGIAMQLTGRPIIDESEKISKYYSDYISAKYPKKPEKPQVAEKPKQQTQNNLTPQPPAKTNEQQKVKMKYATREELIALRNDFFNRYKTLLGVISEDSSNTEKVTAVFSDIDFNQVELDLEKAYPQWSNKDKTFGRLVTEFIEAALDVYQWQIIKNNSNDNKIKVNAAYQIRDAAVKAQNANQKILIIINTKE